MMKQLQRLGRSLMLPVAVLPAAAILLGIGYWVDPAGFGSGNPIAAFLVSAGSSLIDNMGILFAIGVAVGLAKDKNGASAMTGLVGWLVLTNMLSPETIANLTQIPLEQVDPAFGQTTTQFIGILVGIIAAVIYNRFSTTRLPQALAFFSGRRLPPIITAFAALIVAVLMMFIWPPVYNALVLFGTWISGMGALGAGIYGFFNRLLIPTGLHHALNSVFWFDVIGINDIANFLAGTGELGVTGMYQAGFFPVMMFGLPAGAFAMYKMADKDKKGQVGSLMFAAGFASFLTGVTEPLEFAFMFISPVLYFIHALLTGVSLFVSAIFQWTLGFGFSAGFIDGLLSFTNPMANQPYMLIVQGIVFAVLYYVIFVWAIKTFDLKTPGRGGDDESLEEVESRMDSSTSSTDKSAETDQESGQKTGGDKFSQQASVILDGLGGKGNISSINYCTTRLRLSVNDMDKVDESRIKEANIPGVMKPGGNDIHVIVGTEVEFVYNEIEKM